MGGIVFDIDGMFFEFCMSFLNIEKKYNFKNFLKTLLSHFISRFMLFSTLKKTNWKYLKVPLQLLVKWEVVSPNSRKGQWESISDIIVYSLVLIFYLNCGGGLRVMFSCILCYFQHFWK